MLPYFFQNPRRTGALWSSSQHLAEVITSNIGIEQAAHIIEIGPGTGAFTKVILRKKPDTATFFAIEINPKIAKNLRQHFPSLDIAVSNAETLQEMMQERGMPTADVIISGIPWALLSSSEQGRILQSICNALRPGGYFATFAYRFIPSIGGRGFRKKLYSGIFSDIKKSELVLDNIPPAFVYYCRK